MHAGAHCTALHACMRGPIVASALRAPACCWPRLRAALHRSPSIAADARSLPFIATGPLRMRVRLASTLHTHFPHKLSSQVKLSTLSPRTQRLYTALTAPHMRACLQACSSAQRHVTSGQVGWRPLIGPAAHEMGHHWPGQARRLAPAAGSEGPGASTRWLAVASMQPWTRDLPCKHIRRAHGSAWCTGISTWHGWGGGG